MRIGVLMQVLILSFLVTFNLAASEVKSPLEVVNARMSAHNSHNLKVFLGTYSDDIRIYRYPDRQVGKTGKKHLAKIFGPLFSKESVHTDIHHQIENGKYVVNHETVVRQGKIAVYVSIYEVENGLIKSVRFIHQ
jgi:hypothetical protein